jgi:SAM-dependent methyltransferase
MSAYLLLKGYLRKPLVAVAKRRVLRRPVSLALDHPDWAQSLSEPTEFYAECFRYFHQKLPTSLQEHRHYFYHSPGARRGFGEDAFHAMWFALFRQFQPANFLEIGIFRGQTISLAALLAQTTGNACDVCGISPFSSAGDAVSNYRDDSDYYEDTLKNFQHFKLPAPTLVRAYSTDTAAIEFIRSRSWEMIYIDGNHDYPVARQDWEICSQNLKPGGVIVLDDAGLFTRYRPPIFATAGHPGPSRLAQEIDQRHFREVLQVGHNRVFQKIC